MMYITLVNRFVSALNKKGQGMTEYVLVIGLIALAVIISLTSFGTILAEKFIEFTAAVSDA